MIERKCIPYSGNKDFIFLSYSHKNKKQVFEIIKEMQNKAYRIWYDEGIDPGSEWDENIATHIEKAKYFIAFISNEYIESENCKDELNLARDLNKERLLIYLEDVQLPIGMKMRLNRLQAIYKYVYSSEYDFYNKLFSTSGLVPFRNKNDYEILEESEIKSSSFIINDEQYGVMKKYREFFESNIPLLSIKGKDFNIVSKLKRIIDSDCRKKIIDCKIYYVEDWIEEMIEAIRRNELPEIRKKWIGMDILCIDGVELLENKKSTQQELIYIIQKRMDKERKTIFFLHGELDLKEFNIEKKLLDIFQQSIVLDIDKIQEKYVLFDKKNNKRIELWEDSFIMGRNQKKCNIVVADKLASMIHAILIVSKKQVKIKDLSSTTGTFINGNRIEEMEEVLFHVGEKLTIGNTDFFLECCVDEKIVD